MSIYQRPSVLAAGPAAIALRLLHLLRPGKSLLRAQTAELGQQGRVCIARDQATRKKIIVSQLCT